jgi:arginine decarboxylase
MVPKEIFLTKGVGRHKEKLGSFEEALRNAGIAQYNLVKVSSIFPPNCKLISKQAGLKKLKEGQILFCVLSDNSTNEPNRLMAASTGLALPADTSRHGYISEHHSFGQTDEIAGDYAEDLAADMLASTLGIVDEKVQWDERKEIWKLNKQIVKTRNITQSARGEKNGLWTTVVAAAIMII